MPESASINEAILENTNLTNPLRFTRPVLINGERRSEFAWDADGLTVDSYLDAISRAPGSMKVIENDASAHFYLGCALIATACPEVDAMDLKTQLKGADVVKVANLGRFFVLQSESLEDTDSDGPSDGTPTSTPPESGSSGDSPSGPS